MKHLILFFFCLSANLISAQYTISGKVTNELGEELEGASVFLEDTDHAVATNREGFFELKDIPAGHYSLKCTYVGFEDVTREIDLDSNREIKLVLNGQVYGLDAIEIKANTLDETAPFSYEKMDKEEIEMRSAAQDMPYLLRHTPSIVVTSDAGAGVGYTGMRIRGSDPTRINVTINGVPLNDAESHSVFWVDLPDFANSVEEIQIQRGVGPSTNGAGAFGATLALNSNQIYNNSFIDIRSSYGSFNTSRLTFNANTGLINDTWQIEGRYSLINSDGYIDRATSDLESWYFSAARVSDNSSLRLNVFSGKERTYQSWWGTPEAKLDPDVSLTDHYFNNVGAIYLTPEDSINLFDSGRSYNYYTYEDQVDDYRQTHYQLMHGLQATENLVINSTLHYTKGRGFFEEYRTLDDLGEYGLTPLVTDLVRRRWLDNDFYGIIVNSAYTMSPSTVITAGGSWSDYAGEHFGQVIWAEQVEIEDPTRHYYFNRGDKTDLNGYVKIDQKAGTHWELFADMQVRSINYTAEGVDNGELPILIDTSYLFFNPKLGITRHLGESMHAYLSWAVAQREPVRSDFTDAIGTGVPGAETLHDFELGMRKQGEDCNWAVNAYYMLYDDQLVVTGAVNDVGAPIRQNVDQSYRAGIELVWDKRLNDRFRINLNATLSRNRIESFEETIIDYGTGEIVINEFEDTPIAFSPSVISGAALSYSPMQSLNLSLLGKYVSRQFLDNTGSESRSIDPYLINDLIVSYRPPVAMLQSVEIKFMLNNFLSTEYSSNGYTYSYIFGDLITENFYYPQAGINYLLSLNVRF